jgi:GNAT superfamily N-acetyltransferase
MIIVRQALEKDIPRILELYRQLSFHPEDFHMPPVHEVGKVFRQMGQYPGFYLLVAEDAGQVVGTSVLAVLPGFAHGTSPFAVVEYVVVDEAYRSRGIGKLLMESVIALAKEAGCYKIMLTSDVRRERAHKFYKSLGFEPSAHGFRLYFKSA